MYNEITQSIVYMICSDLQPFSIVERNGFKNLLKTVAPDYEMPSRVTLKKLVNNKFKAASSSMKHLLNGKKCTLTIDIWTDIRKGSFMSLTTHFVGDTTGDKILSVILSVEPLHDRHTSEDIVQKLRLICIEWDIQAQNIVTLVTHNDSNVVNASINFVGPKKHFNCYAHIFNLVCQNSMKHCPEAVQLLDKIEKIISWFRQNVLANNELRRVTDKKLIQSVPNRWDSTFRMVERFLKLRPKVNEIINRHPSAPAMITASEAEALKQMRDVLRPLYIVTVELNKEKYLTSSLCIPITKITKEKLEKVPSNKESVKLLKDNVLREFDKEFGQIENCTLLGLATLTDPRFKTMYFTNQTTCSKYINIINTKILEMQKLKPELLEANSDDDWFSRYHTKHVREAWMTNEARLQKHLRDLHPELSMYLDSPSEIIEQKPLHFWRDTKWIYPVLSEVVKEYLPMVATSLPSDRLFSKPGQVCNTGTHLEGKMAAKLLFLNSIPQDMWN